MSTNIYDCEFNAQTHEIPENSRSFGKLLQQQANNYPNRRFLGTREFWENGQRGAYEWYSFQEVLRLSQLLAKGMLGLGVRPGDRVGLISGNRVEWTLVDYACALAGFVLVPLYDTQSAEDIAYVVEDAELKLCFAALDKVAKLVPVRAKLAQVVVLDDRADDRAYIQGHAPHVALPALVAASLRSQLVFDRFDEEQGIFDPAPPMKDCPKLDALGNAPQIFRALPDERRFFAYRVDEKWAKALTKAMKPVDLAIVSHSFQQLVMLGYTAQFGTDFANNALALPQMHVDLGVPEPTPDQLFSFVYTSGTTGKPKGVMLTQLNVIHTGFLFNKHRFLKEKVSVNSLGAVMPNGRQEFILSYLPLAHIFMRALQAMQLFNGGALGYGSGQAQTLFEDIKELRITFFGLVPRVAQKLIQGIKAKLSKASATKQFLFRTMYEKRFAMYNKLKTQYNEMLWKHHDEKTVQRFLTVNPCAHFAFPSITNIVFNQFPKMFGGRCRIFVVGSAPLASQDGEFLAIAFNMHTFEGWGMTETAANGLVQEIDTMNYGAVGRALDSATQLRIQSVPEMDYRVDDSRIVDLGGRQERVVCPRGELLIKGPSVFQGYYKDEKKTAESFSDGFFMTGDIAEFNPVTKEIRLIDRKRGIVKLSHGEFISINQIEDAIGKSQFVEQVFLHANRYHAFTTAVVVPNAAAFRSAGFAAGEDLSRSHAALKLLLEDIRRVCKEFKLRSFETPKTIVLDANVWTPENGLLTPGMKVKRTACKAKYNKMLDHLCSNVANVDNNAVDELIKAAVDIHNMDWEQMSEQTSLTISHSQK